MPSLLRIPWISRGWTLAGNIYPGKGIKESPKQNEYKETHTKTYNS